MTKEADYIRTPAKNYGDLISIALRVKTYFEYHNSEHAIFREMAVDMGRELEALAIEWDNNTKEV